MDLRYTQSSENLEGFQPCFNTAKQQTPTQQKETSFSEAQTTTNNLANAVDQASSKLENAVDAISPFKVERCSFGSQQLEAELEKTSTYFSLDPTLYEFNKEGELVLKVDVLASAYGKELNNQIKWGNSWLAQWIENSPDTSKLDEVNLSKKDSKVMADLVKHNIDLTPEKIEQVKTKVALNTLEQLKSDSSHVEGKLFKAHSVIQKHDSEVANCMEKIVGPVSPSSSLENVSLKELKKTTDNLLNNHTSSLSRQVSQGLKDLGQRMVDLSSLKDSQKQQLTDLQELKKRLDSLPPAPQIPAACLSWLRFKSFLKKPTLIKEDQKLKVNNSLIPYDFSVI